jgi:hypothetical protein
LPIAAGNMELLSGIGEFTFWQLLSKTKDMTIRIIDLRFFMILPR